MKRAAAEQARRLAEDAEAFLKEQPHLREDPAGRCCEASRDLAAFLRARGHAGARPVEFCGMRAPLGADAHAGWLQIEPEYLYHVAVRVGRHVVDVTGRQYGERYAATVAGRAEFEGRWEKSRPVGARTWSGAGKKPREVKR